MAKARKNIRKAVYMPPKEAKPRKQSAVGLAAARKAGQGDAATRRHNRLSKAEL